MSRGQRCDDLLESSLRLYGRALGYGGKRYYPGYMARVVGARTYVFSCAGWTGALTFYRGVCVDARAGLRQYIMQRGRRRIIREIKLNNEVRAITEMSEWARGNVAWLPGCEPD